MYVIHLHDINCSGNAFELKWDIVVVMVLFSFNRSRLSVLDYCEMISLVGGYCRYCLAFIQLLLIVQRLFE